MKIIRRTRKEVLRLWVAALRSDEYKQGHGWLRTVGGSRYCCFGVLCDLAARDGGQQWRQRGGEMWVYDNNSSYIPDRMAKWLRLQEYVTILVNRNDTQKWSFAKIADYIEKKIL